MVFFGEIIGGISTIVIFGGSGDDLDSGLSGVSGLGGERDGFGK